jgi:hypothetical protein
MMARIFPPNAICKSELDYFSKQDFLQKKCPQNALAYWVM